MYEDASPYQLPEGMEKKAAGESLLLLCSRPKRMVRQKQHICVPLLLQQKVYGILPKMMTC